MNKEQEMPKKKKRPEGAAEAPKKRKRPEGEVRSEKDARKATAEVPKKRKRPEGEVRAEKTAKRTNSEAPKKRKRLEGEVRSEKAVRQTAAEAPKKRKRPEGEAKTVKTAKPTAAAAPKKGNTSAKKGKKKTNSKKNNLVSNIILVIAIIVFLVSGGMLVKSILPYFQGGAEYDDIKSLAIETEKTDENGEVIFQVDFERLKEINSDTVAWIRFDEPEVISYPVVQGTDNSKYLTATFQANDNKLGTIFMDYRNTSDFSDRNTIIYGHNMKIGGEMFSQLVEYKKEDFYKENPYFYIYTPDGMVRTYQIFSAGVVADDLDNYLLDFESDEAFEDYLKLCESHSAYDTGVAVDEDSKIVSLSTCTNIRDDERFLVQGVLIEEKLVVEE